MKYSNVKTQPMPQGNVTITIKGFDEFVKLRASDVAQNGGGK